MEITKPFDALNFFRHKNVLVSKTRGGQVEGKIVAFDLGLNLSIETKNGLEFVGGYTVESISFLGE